MFPAGRITSTFSGEIKCGGSLLTILLGLFCYAFVRRVTIVTENPHLMPLCRGFTLEEASLLDIQAALTAGKLTSVDLVTCYFERIKQIQPLTNALLEANPEALAIAAQLDKERQGGAIRSPLHGIPIVLKGNIATSDSMNTTAGSYALLGSIVPRDAHVVALLRRAGAIILGKANLSEFADFRARVYSEGWSAIGGQTHNAYVLPADPGGSSSGSAVMVAANMVAAGIGTETDGSVVAPSSRNMLVGLKPTVGLTSRSGVIPLAPSQDSVGCMGRSVADVALMLSAMAGIDPRDVASAAAEGHVGVQYTECLRKGGLEGKRFGVPRSVLWEAASTALQLPALEEVLEVMHQLGAVIVDPIDIPTIRQLADPSGWTWMPNELTVCLFEFKEALNSYLADLKASPVRTLQDIITFNQKHADLELVSPWNPNQDLLIQSQATEGGLQNSSYLQALQEMRRNARQLGIDYVLQKYSLDALLLPSDPMSASSQPAAAAGYPLVTVPVGVDREGVPFGMTLMGTAWSECSLLSVAYALEQATRRRRPPAFLSACQYSHDRADNSC